MYKRPIEWFYYPASKYPDVFSLPPYVEIYYHVFKDTFKGETEEDRRYTYLSWLMSTESGQYELKYAHNDEYLLKLLDRQHFNKEVVPGIFLTKFHYYYYKQHEKTFREWGIDIEQPLGKMNLIYWYCTLDLDKNPFPYLSAVRARYLRPSKNLSKTRMEMTILLELYIEREKLVNPRDFSNLDRELALLLFSFSSNRYELNFTQIKQLFNFKDGQLGLSFYLDLYDSCSKTSMYNKKLSELDVNPSLVLACEKDSTRYCGSRLQVNIIVESLIDGYELTASDSYTRESLEASISWLLFNYSKSKYILTDAQVSQLLNYGSRGLLFDEYLEIYNYVYERNSNYLCLTELDVWPCLSFEMQKISTVYSSKYIDITRMLEAVIDGCGLLPKGDYSPEELEATLSWIIFNYSKCLYRLTTDQINQLTRLYEGKSLVSAYYDEYRRVYAPEFNCRDIADMDINPELKTTLVADEKNYPKGIFI